MCHSFLMCLPIFSIEIYDTWQWICLVSINKMNIWWYDVRGRMQNDRSYDTKQKLLLDEESDLVGCIDTTVVHWRESKRTYFSCRAYIVYLSKVVITFCVHMTQKPQILFVYRQTIDSERNIKNSKREMST